MLLYTTQQVIEGRFIYAKGSVMKLYTYVRIDFVLTAMLNTI